MNKSNIPSDEDFARADRFMEERYKNLGVVENAVLETFSSKCPLHSVFLLVQRDVDFRLYVFFEQDLDIKQCKESGICNEIEDYVYQELERVGRGSRSEIRVAFEYDSDENVTNAYEGDYYMRLR